MEREITRKRKTRNDRVHLIYEIINTKTDDFYIGITVRNGQAIKGSLQKRWKQHVSRAIRNEKDFTICQAIREHGADAFVIRHLESVRGKKAAHEREVEWIEAYNPTLNQHRKKIK